jgi:hypothetical protein
MVPLLVHAFPNTSVLMDGVIPTLEGLFGNEWGAPFIILQEDDCFSTEIIFDFSNSVEEEINSTLILVMFNCPDYGSAAKKIEILFEGIAAVIVYPTEISCDSLVEICIPLGFVPSTISSVTTRFQHFRDSRYIHLAEVTFLEGSLPCPAFRTIGGNVPPILVGSSQPQTPVGSSQPTNTGCVTQGKTPQIYVLLLLMFEGIACYLLLLLH